MRTAATAWERGDRAAARAALDKNAADVRGLAKQYNIAPGKISQALAQPEEMANDIDLYAPTSAAGMHSLKMRKSGAKAQMRAAW